MGVYRHTVCVPLDHVDTLMVAGFTPFPRNSEATNCSANGTLPSPLTLQSATNEIALWT